MADLPLHEGDKVFAMFPTDSGKRWYRGRIVSIGMGEGDVGKIAILWSDDKITYTDTFETARKARADFLAKYPDDANWEEPAPGHGDAADDAAAAPTPDDDYDEGEESPAGSQESQEDTPADSQEDSPGSQDAQADADDRRDERTITIWSPYYEGKRRELFNQWRIDHGTLSVLEIDKCYKFKPTDLAALKGLLPARGDAWMENYAASLLDLINDPRKHCEALEDAELNRQAEMRQDAADSQCSQDLSSDSDVGEDELSSGDEDDARAPRVTTSTDGRESQPLVLTQNALAIDHVAIRERLLRHDAPEPPAPEIVTPPPELKTIPFGSEDWDKYADAMRWRTDKLKAALRDIGGGPGGNRSESRRRRGRGMAATRSRGRNIRVNRSRAGGSAASLKNVDHVDVGRLRRARATIYVVADRDAGAAFAESVLKTKPKVAALIDAGCTRVERSFAAVHESVDGKAPEIIAICFMGGPSSPEVSEALEGDRATRCVLAAKTFRSNIAPKRGAANKGAMYMEGYVTRTRWPLNQEYIEDGTGIKRRRSEKERRHGRYGAPRPGARRTRARDFPEIGTKRSTSKGIFQTRAPRTAATSRARSSA